MRDNWKKDLPSEGMKAKINRKYHVFLSRLDCGNSLDYYSVIRFIFPIRPGVGVGAGASVGVNQEPGVGAGVGTAPPRLCTLGSVNVTLIRASFVLAAVWSTLFSQIMRLINVCPKFRFRYAKCELGISCIHCRHF